MSHSPEDLPHLIKQAKLYTIFHFDRSRTMLQVLWKHWCDTKVDLKLSVSSQLQEQLKEAAYIVTLYKLNLKIGKGQGQETAIIRKEVFFLQFTELYGAIKNKNLVDDEQTRNLVMPLLPFIKSSKGDLQLCIKLYVQSDPRDPDFKFLCALFTNDKEIRTTLFEKAVADEDYFLAKYIGHAMIQVGNVSAIDLVTRFLPLKCFRVIDEYTNVYNVDPAHLYSAILITSETVKLFNTIYGCLDELCIFQIPKEGNLLVKIAILLTNPKHEIQVHRYLPFFGSWSPFKILHFINTLVNDGLPDCKLFC